MEARSPRISDGGASQWGPLAGRQCSRWIVISMRSQPINLFGPTGGGVFFVRQAELLEAMRLR